MPVLISELAGYLHACRQPQRILRVYSRRLAGDAEYISITSGFRLLCCVEGSRPCQVSLDDGPQTIDLQPGTALILAPYCPLGTTPTRSFLSIGCSSNGQTGRCTAGQAPVSRNRRGTGPSSLSKGAMNFNRQGASDTADLMRVILRQRCASDSALLRSLTNNLIQLCEQALAPDTDADRHVQTFSDLCEWIRSHPDRHIDRQHIATQVGCHPNHLPRLFKRHAGCTFQQFITQARMDRARQLLLDDLSIRRIAKLCGYADSGSLIAHFKRAQGCTPKTWRDQQLAKGRNLEQHTSSLINEPKA